MNSQNHSVNMNKVPDHMLTITVKITRIFRLRMWLAFVFLRAAAILLNANIEIEEGEEDE